MDKEYLNPLREAERKAEIQDAIRVCSSKMSLPLYMAFWFADLIYAPHLKWEFLALRAIMIPVNLSVYHLIQKFDSLTAVQNIALGFAFANSFIITVMIYLTEGTVSPYYAGLNLVGVGILSFLPWSNRYLMLCMVTVYGPYFLFAVYFGLGKSDLTHLALNSFFILGTVVASLVSRHFNEQLRKKELDSRLKLREEIRSREEIIRRKTEEGLKLATLAKQFSPQVVHAIKSGELDILKAVYLSQICAIFVDIVDSTDHIVRIDKDSVNKVLSLFMEDTMKVLLKHDITIDKFLGDGVLGFSNAPMRHIDFIQRVVNAGLEIKSRIANHSESYSRSWGSEFQIRIGVASGYANVGFYGSDEYFRSYTAIGKVINLACRLCASGLPNQITVSQDVVTSLPAEEYETRDLGPLVLKGFDTGTVKAFEVVRSYHIEESGSDILHCPDGHGVLHLDTTPTGIYVFRCRSCGFTFDLERPRKSAA